MLFTFPEGNSFVIARTRHAVTGELNTALVNVSLEFSNFIKYLPSG